MLRSYEAIQRVLKRLGTSPDSFAFCGSRQYMESQSQPMASEAADDLIRKAMNYSRERPLYVLTIGAPTNVASAIVKAPDIRNRIVVVWLGGHALWFSKTDEFNCRQDIHASRVLFDSGIALVMIPCRGVCDRLLISREELREQVAPMGPIGAYLMKIFDDEVPNEPAYTRVIWDMSAVAWVICSSWFSSGLTNSPHLTDDLRWSLDSSRHPIRVVNWINRRHLPRLLCAAAREHIGRLQMSPSMACHLFLDRPTTNPPGADTTHDTF